MAPGSIGLRGAICFKPAVDGAHAAPRIGVSAYRLSRPKHVFRSQPVLCGALFVVMNVTQIIPTLATAVAVTSAITDVRDRRIPNRLTYPAMIAGLVVQSAVHGWRGLLLSLVGG